MNKIDNEEAVVAAKFEYEKALAAALIEIEQLLEQRSRIDRRLAELKSTTEGLSRLLGIETRPTPARLVELMNQVPADPGITNGIRRLLASSKVPMRPTDIRVGLESLGFDLSQYVNPGAVVHNTLARLERQGEVARISDRVDQAFAYVLVGQRKTLKQMVSEAGGVSNPYWEKLAAILKGAGSFPNPSSKELEEIFKKLAEALKETKETSK